MNKYKPDIIWAAATLINMLIAALLVWIFDSLSFGETWLYITITTIHFVVLKESLK